jgi:hypothetical protein
MAGDSFTETTSKGWGSRIGDSIKGIVVGLVLFVASFVILFWNEGRAVTTAKTLEEGAANVVSVSSDKVDPANDKKLVHMTGPAATTETLTDDQFVISANAIKLARKVQMYQWTEKSESKTTKKVGGGEETTTTYTYNKDWSDRLVESGKFKKPDGHANPPSMPFESATRTAKVVTLGAFTLPPGIIADMNNFEKREIKADDLAKLPADVKGKARIASGEFYIVAAPAAAPAPTTAPAGPESAAPASQPAVPVAEAKIGDVRVSFSVVAPGTFSLMAKQIGSTFEPYTAKTGKSIQLITAGTKSAEGMIAAEMASNRMWTWLGRAGGFLAMFIGLSMIFKPLSVIADVLPFLGDLVGMGTGLVAFVIALVLSLITIAIAWVVARPVVGIVMLAAAAGVIVLFVMRSKAKAKAKAAAAAPAAGTPPTA